MRHELPSVSVYPTRRFSVIGPLAEVFVPGRVCLFGEHSDWCTVYSGVDGRALVVSTETGIFARCGAVADTSTTTAGSFRYISSDGVEHTQPLCPKSLSQSAANASNYFAYVDGTVACFLERFPWDRSYSIFIHNYATTLPRKKGLSSSAAVCVLVVRCLSFVMLGRRLSPNEEMELAYLGERRTPSLCGKLDQVCAFMSPRQVALVRFHYDSGTAEVNVHVDEIIEPSQPIFMVLACVPGKKDTIAILSALQNAAKNNLVELLHIFGQGNHDLVEQAANAIRLGKGSEALGKIAVEARRRFDDIAMPCCREELSAPNLRRLIDDSIVTRYATGIKQIGAGGDGSAFIICKNPESQDCLVRYLTNDRGMEVWPITL